MISPGFLVDFIGKSIGKNEWKTAYFLW
jgi:hypothetical protein